MLYYRTKRSANNKPMYRGKGRRQNEEKWSIYIADELFTEKEAARMNLNMDYLELVEIPRFQVHRQGCFRVANFDASIKLVKQKEEIKPLSDEAAAELLRRMTDRSLYKEHASKIADVRPATVLVRFKVPNKKAKPASDQPDVQAAK